MAQMFEDFVVTFSLTCVDEAIARELFARMLTAELYREKDLPTPRDLEVTPRHPESFAGVDLVEDTARLHRALRRTAHKLGRYIDKAYLFAVTNNYLPLRTGVLDPLLRDPLDSTQWDGLAGTGPIEGSRPLHSHSKRMVIPDDLEVLQTAVREVREILGVRSVETHVWDTIMPPLLNHIDFIFDLNRRPRTEWPGMMEMMPSTALRTWLERIQVGTDLDWIQPDQRERYGTIDAAWRAREFSAKLQTVIHADLIPLLRQHREHKSLTPISAYLSEALTARWRPSAADMQKLHGGNGIPRGLEMDQWERPYNLTELVSLQQALFMTAWQHRVHEHGAQPPNLIRSRKDLLSMPFVQQFVTWARSTETQGAADELWKVTTEELFTKAQTLPLPFVRELLEPIVLLGEFVPTQDRNFEGTPFARNVDVQFRGFPEGMIAKPIVRKNADFLPQRDLCRIDRLPFYFPDPSDQATLSAYLAQAFAQARDFARDNVPPFVTHMRGFVCLNRPNVEEVLAHWVPGILPMRELDERFDDMGRHPALDTDKSDSDDSSDSSSMGFGRTRTPQQQVRSIGQANSRQVMETSGLKSSRASSASQSKMATRPQVVPSWVDHPETWVVPKKDFCLSFNSRPARCELKHKCAPPLSDSALQQERAYLQHDQAYMMRLQQRNARLQPAKTPPTRSQPVRPPPQIREYRDALQVRQQRSEARMASPFDVAHAKSTIMDHRSTRQNPLTNASMSPDDILAAKCRQHAVAWGMVQSKEEDMDIDYAQHVALEQHYSRQKAQSGIPREEAQPSGRSLLQELDEESHAAWSPGRGFRAVDADSRAASDVSGALVEYDSTGTHDDLPDSGASHFDMSDEEAAHSEEASFPEWDPQSLADLEEPIEVDDLALATEIANELYQVQRQNAHQPGWLGPGEAPQVMNYIHKVPIASPPSPSREQRQAALNLWQKDLMVDLINEVKSGDELLGPGYQWALGALQQYGITESDIVDQQQTLDGVEDLLDGLNIPFKQRAFLINAWPARKFFVQELRKRAEESNRTLLGISWIKPISTMDYEKFLTTDHSDGYHGYQSPRATTVSEGRANPIRKQEAKAPLDPPIEPSLARATHGVEQGAPAGGGKELPPAVVLSA